eukprot:UN10682
MLKIFILSTSDYIQMDSIIGLFQSQREKSSCSLEAI